MTRSELVHLCKTGSKEAMGSLYSTYFMRMMNIVRKYVSDKKASEDILHDGFIVIFTNIDKLKDENKLESWMGGIMRNLSLKYLEKLDLPSILDDIEIADAPSSDYILSFEELSSIIDKLPTGYKTIFRLSVLENKSHKEIAEILGITPGTSSSQLFHAKELLRKLIKDYQTTLDIFILIILSLIFINKDNSVKHSGNAYIPDNQLATNALPVVVDSIIISHNDEIMPVGTSDKKIVIPRSTIIGMSDSIENYVKHSTAIDKTTNGDLKIIEIVDSMISGSSLLLTDQTSQSIDIPAINYKNNNDKWNLSLSYNISKNSNNYTVSTILGGGDISSDIDNESAELESKYHYNIPIIFGVSLERNLNSRIGLNLGLNFSYLRSSVTYTLEEKGAKRTFNHYYLNLPIGVNYKAATFNHCSLYIPGRIGIDIPLKTHISTTNPVNIKLPEINLPKLRVFVSSGVGFNYNLTRDVNLYIEPSIKYYINKTTEPSIWEGRNFEFNIPIGIRYSW